MSVVMATGDPMCNCGCGAYIFNCGCGAYIFNCCRARNPGFYGDAAPITLGNVWTGITCPTPELLAQALTDREDDNPAFFIDRSNMPNEQDPEVTETLAPPTDRETNPENEKPEPRDAIAPPAPTNPFAKPPEWWEGSFFQDTFNKMQGGFAALEKAAAGQDAILAAIERADSNSQRNYALLRDEIRHLKDSDLKQDQRLKEGDKRFDLIEQSIADLKEELVSLVTREMAAAATKIEALEKQLAEAKADVPARQAPATPG